jgi:hypothetical protein
MSRRNHKPPKSEDHNVYGLYTTTDPLIVPRWQRDYAWDPNDHVKKLLDDLEVFRDNSRADPGRYYLLGQVIVVVNELDENEIVDGQQRLTTIYLLLIVLLNSMRIRVDVTKRPASQYFALLEAAIESLEGGLRLRSPYQEGTKILKHLLEHGQSNLGDLGSLSQPQRNLLDVYEVVEEWVNDNLGDESLVLEYVDLILNRVYFTCLSIEDIPLALDYFEKMNRRGLPLAAADLLKNYMFAQVPDSDFDGLTESWKDMAKELDKISRSSLKSTEGFIKAWAVSEHGSKLNGTEQLLDFWKKKLDSTAKITDFKNSLKSVAEFYKQSANGINFKTNSGPILEGVNYLLGSQHLPVMFAGRHLKKFDYLCQLLERRFLLYTFSRERNSAFESMIPNWCKEIAKLDSDASEAEILAASKSANGFVVRAGRENTIAYIENLSYAKGSHLKRIRMVIAIVSRYLDGVSKTGDYSENLSTYLKTVRKGVAGIDLDHVYGQKFFEHATSDEKLVYNSIGSLTPVFSSDHREQTHLSPIEKVNMYRDSRYVLTKSLAPFNDVSPRLKIALEEIQAELPISLSNWTTDFVRARSSFIAARFIDALQFEELVTNAAIGDEEDDED